MGYSPLIKGRGIFPNCINCDTDFNLSVDNENKKSKQTALSQIGDSFLEDNSNSLEFEHGVPTTVLDAIFYIYGISHADLTKEICDSSQLTSDSDNCTFALCEKCAPVVNDIYKAHLQLDKLSTEKSVLVKSIKNQRLLYSDSTIKIEHGWERDDQESQDEKIILGGYGESESPTLFTPQGSTDNESDVEFDPLTVENARTGGGKTLKLIFNETTDQCYYTYDDNEVVDRQQVVVCLPKEEAEKVEAQFENPMPILWQALPISVFTSDHPEASTFQNSNEEWRMNGNQKRKSVSNYETYSTIQPEVSTLSESNGLSTHSESARNSLRRKVKATLKSQQIKIVAIKKRNNEYPPPPPPPTSKKKKKSKVSIERHQCPQCFKTYFTLFSLRNHLKTHEADYEPLRCEVCSAEYESLNGLQNHLKYNHN